MRLAGSTRAIYVRAGSRGQDRRAEERQTEIWASRNILVRRVIIKQYKQSQRRLQRYQAHAESSCSLWLKNDNCVRILCDIIINNILLKHRLNTLIKLIEIFRSKKPGTLPFEAWSIEADDDAEICALGWEPIHLYNLRHGGISTSNDHSLEIHWVLSNWGTPGWSGGTIRIS